MAFCCSSSWACNVRIDIRRSGSFGRCWGLFPAIVSLLRTVEKERGLAEEVCYATVGEGLLLYWLMLFIPLATGVNALVYHWWRLHHLRVFQLMHWQRWIQRLWRTCCLAPLERNTHLSSSTFCNSRLHNDKGFCADHPQSQTGSHTSALLP